MNSNNSVLKPCILKVNQVSKNSHAFEISCIDSNEIYEQMDSKLTILESHFESFFILHYQIDVNKLICR